MRTEIWQMSIEPAAVILALLLSLVVVIGTLILSNMRSRRPAQLSAEDDGSKRPAMHRASVWITCAALLFGLLCVLLALPTSHTEDSHSYGVVDPAFKKTAAGPIIKPVLEPNIKPVPKPRIVRPPAPNVIAQGQVAVAVPLGEIKPVPTGKVTFNGDLRNPVWKIEGKWESTTEDARRAVYQQAQEELVNFLRSQEPPLKWVPPVSFISDRQRRLVANRPEEETRDFREIGTMRRYVLEMTLPTEARREIWQHESELHARQRMLFLAKILAGLVSVLAATAGYLRLDELTKGYYTGWLRLAAAGLLGAAGLVLALLA